MFPLTWLANTNMSQHKSLNKDSFQNCNMLKGSGMIATQVEGYYLWYISI